MKPPRLRLISSQSAADIENFRRVKEAALSEQALAIFAQVYWFKGLVWGFIAGLGLGAFLHLAVS